MLSPHVAIAGGGPAGFLAGIVLAQCHVQVTLLEQSPVADPWSSKSYSISLNERGLGALDTAGVLREVQAASTIRKKVIMELPGGIQKELPKDPPSYAITRPALVECLEQCLQAQSAIQDGITIQRGVEVSGVAFKEENGDLLSVELDDGSTLDCTHLVAADGKWSAVRSSLPDLEQQFQVQEEPAFGVIMNLAVAFPTRWATDATTLFIPQSKEQTYYCLAAPLPDGQYSVSAICFNEIQQEHPWLVPPTVDERKDIDHSDKTWEAEYTQATSLQAEDEVQEQFAKMLQDELPLFYKDITNNEYGNNNDMEERPAIRINRRTSWLKPLIDNPNYTDATGRVALIGDAAHAMTPSKGEGCNCALESAVLLGKELRSKADDASTRSLTVEDITDAFRTYGTRRPPEVIPIQIKSAVANRYQERTAPPSPSGGPANK